MLAAATLFRPEAVPRDVIKRAFSQRLDWQDRVFERALDSCFDLTLLEGRETLRGHQLCWQ